MSPASAVPIPRRVLALALSLPLSAAWAQAARVSSLVLPLPAPIDRVEAARGNVDVRIDGRLDDPVWRAVKPATAFVQREPNEGAPATLATEVRVIITDDAVIIGARLQDDHKTLASALGPPADGVPGGYLDDYFEVQIDPHRAHLTAFAFSVAPGGRRRAWMVARDGTRDESWNLQWTAATHVDPNGWSVEIRIPLSEFHVAPGTEHWGVQFARFSWGRQEMDVLKSSPANAVIGASQGR